MVNINAKEQEYCYPGKLGNGSHVFGSKGTSRGIPGETPGTSQGKTGIPGFHQGRTSSPAVSPGNTLGKRRRVQKGGRATGKTLVFPLVKCSRRMRPFGSGKPGFPPGFHQANTRGFAGKCRFSPWEVPGIPLGKTWGKSGSFQGDPDRDPPLRNTRCFPRQNRVRLQHLDSTG